MVSRPVRQVRSDATENPRHRLGYHCHIVEVTLIVPGVLPVISALRTSWCVEHLCTGVRSAPAVKPQSYHLHPSIQPKASARAVDVFSTQPTALGSPFRLRCNHLVGSRATPHRTKHINTSHLHTSGVLYASCTCGGCFLNAAHGLWFPISPAM